MFTTDLLLYSCGSDMSSISLELSYIVTPLTNNYTGVGRLIFFILFFLLGINCSCTAVQSIILIISHIQTLFFRRTADFGNGLLLFFFQSKVKKVYLSISSGVESWIFGVISADVRHILSPLSCCVLHSILQ